MDSSEMFTNELKNIYGIELPNTQLKTHLIYMLAECYFDYKKSLEKTSNKEQRIYLLSRIEAIKYAYEILGDQK